MGQSETWANLLDFVIAMNKAVSTKISHGTDNISESIVNICKAYGKEVMVAAASGTAHLSICNNLKLLPLLALGLIKSVSSRQLLIYSIHSHLPAGILKFH